VGGGCGGGGGVGGWGLPPGGPLLLGERGELDGLRARADAVRRCCRRAARRLLGERGTWDCCCPVPTPATGSASRRLADLLGRSR